MHVITGLGGLLLVTALAAADDPVTVAPVAVEVKAAPSAVTLYQGSAAVTRVAPLERDPGVYEVRFTDLPPTVRADSLQAKVGSPAKLLDVRFEATTLPAPDAGSNTEVAALEKERESLRAALAELQSNRSLVAAQETALDAIVARIAQVSGERAGGELDPAKLKAQLDFIATERARAAQQRLALDASERDLKLKEASVLSRLAAIGGVSTTSRSGVVVLALPVRDSVDVALTYAVGSATWRPAYQLRAAPDLSGLDVEYDAAIMQRTGEAWNDVRLALSTATPGRSASPAELEPIVVDKAERWAVGSAAAPARDGFAAAESPPPPPPPAAPMESEGRRLADAVREAAVEANATVATFVLPRTVTIPTDATREQRTRIATLALTPEYVHVARPAVDGDVFLRGTTRNDSPYQLLAGRATVFLGNDSVGTVWLEDVASGDEVDLWFGPDRRIGVTRTLVSKSTSQSGLFSKTSDTTWQYRIDLTSAVGRPTRVEVWDRMPVSRQDEIKVTLADVTPSLATDAEYQATARKEGLLKWTVELPAASATSAPSPVPIRFTIRLSAPSDVQLTPFPE